MNLFKNWRKNREEVLMKDIREYLFEQLIQSAPDFEKVNRKDRIIRKKAYGKDIFHLAIYKRSYGYAIEGYAFKRIDELEVYISDIVVEEKDKNNTTTIGGELGKLLNRPLPRGYNVVPNFEYDIVTRSDLKKVTRKFIRLLEKTEVLFYKKFNTLDELNNEINRELIENNKYCRFYFNKMCLGLTLLKLTNDSRYEEAKTLYYKEVEKFVPNDLKNYERLINRLENR